MRLFTSSCSAMSEAALVKFHRWTLVALAAAGLLAAPAPPAHAAPDNTRGKAIMAAEVDSDGMLERGSGATSATRIGQGLYNVQFDRDVTNCYPFATLGSNAGVQTGTVAGASQNGNIVTVGTTNAAGGLTDRPFHLLVFCNK